MPAKIDRLRFNILAKDMEFTAQFYERLANFKRAVTSDWSIVLTAPGDSGIELGIIDQVSEFVPRAARGIVEGCYLTLAVDNVYRAVEIASEMDVEIVEEPLALAYGQTRAIIRDPNGLVLDISTPTAQLSVPPQYAAG